MEQDTPPQQPGMTEPLFAPDQPAEPAPQPRPQRKKSRSKIVMLTVMCLAVLATVAFAGLWYTTKQSDKKKLDVLSSRFNQQTQNLASTQTILKDAKARLAEAHFLPKPTDFSPTCSAPGNENSDIVIAPVMDQPVDGYQLFLVDCKKSLALGKSKAQLTGFKVNSDGTFTYAYGASSLEPFCIHKGILGEATATKMVQETGLALCKKS